MRKDESGVRIWNKHTRKRLGLRRRINKGVRRAIKSAIRKILGS